VYSENRKLKITALKGKRANKGEKKQILIPKSDATDENNIKTWRQLNG